MRFDVRKVLVLLLLLAAPAAEAQLWRGGAAVEVRVEQQKGGAVADAQVRFIYKDVQPEDGPPPVTTDSKGRATVGGLAPGAWRVEVSRQGFMSHVMELTVRENGKPVVEDAAQLNVPGAQAMMEVKVSRGRGGAPAPREAVVAERAPEPAPRPTPPPPAPPRETPPTPRTEAQPMPPAAAPEPEAPRASPNPSPAPAIPAPQPQTPPAERPAPAPQPQAQPAPPAERPSPAPAPETPRPAPVEPTPRPTPPAPAPAPVTPAPAPAAPAPDPVRLRTARDRTCPECPPDESAMSTERVIPPGAGTGCGADITARLRGGTVPANLPDGCHVLRIVLPAGARYTGYRYEIEDSGASFDCRAGQDCPGGTGRWTADPVLIRDASGTILLAPFETGRVDRQTRAVFTAYFGTGGGRRR